MTLLEVKDLKVSFPTADGVVQAVRGVSFNVDADNHRYDELIEAGSITAARAAGKARIEGKDYVMRDGDVVEFRFNV